MHPHSFYSNFFNPRRRDEVFVITSFAAEFEPRWRDIIEPCIREDLQLAPVRVDYSTSGESVVFDILDGIGHSRLVLAEITSTRLTDRHGREWPQRNGNVMWELGIAHTLRLPEEVVVIRSDSDPSIFDLTQFRAFGYDPHDARESRRILCSLMKDRLRACEQSATVFVERCATSLDLSAWTMLMDAIELESEGGLTPPKTMGDRLVDVPYGIAVTRLLELGLLETHFGKPTGSSPNEIILVRYRATPLGVAVARRGKAMLGLPR